MKPGDRIEVYEIFGKSYAICTDFGSVLKTVWDKWGIKHIGCFIIKTVK